MFLLLVVYPLLVIIQSIANSQIISFNTIVLICILLSCRRIFFLSHTGLIYVILLSIVLSISLLNSIVNYKIVDESYSTLFLIVAMTLIGLNDSNNLSPIKKVPFYKKILAIFLIACSLSFVLQNYAETGVLSLNIFDSTGDVVLSYQFLGLSFGYIFLKIFNSNYSTFFSFPIFILSGARGAFFSYLFSSFRNLFILFEFCVIVILFVFLFFDVKDLDLGLLRFSYIFGDSYNDRLFYLNRFDDLFSFYGVFRYDVVLNNEPGSYIHNILDFVMSFGLLSIIFIPFLILVLRYSVVERDPFFVFIIYYSVFFGGITFFLIWYALAFASNKFKKIF